MLQCCADKGIDYSSNSSSSRHIACSLCGAQLDHHDGGDQKWVKEFTNLLSLFCTTIDWWKSAHCETPRVLCDTLLYCMMPCYRKGQTFCLVCCDTTLSYTRFILHCLIWCHGLACCTISCYGVSVLCHAVLQEIADTLCFVLETAGMSQDVRLGSNIHQYQVNTLQNNRFCTALDYPVQSSTCCVTYLWWGWVVSSQGPSPVQQSRRTSWWAPHPWEGSCRCPLLPNWRCCPPAALCLGTRLRSGGDWSGRRTWLCLLME